MIPIWAILALTSAVFWACANAIDKHVLDKYVKEPQVALVIFGFVSLFFGVIFLAFRFALMPLWITILTLVTGGIYAALIYLYFKALKTEEVSRVAPLFKLDIIFTIILAAIFLGEILSPVKYIGIGFLAGGAILLSMKKEIKIGVSKSLLLMLCAAALLAIYYVLVKYLLGFADYWSVFAYTRIGSFLFLIPLIYIYWPQLKEITKIHGKRVAGLMTVSESLNVVGALAIIVAASIGLITLVNALSATQPFFILIIALILSIFLPKILKEELKGSIIALKLVAIMMIVVGVILTL